MKLLYFYIILLSVIAQQSVQCLEIHINRNGEYTIFDTLKYEIKNECNDTLFYKVSLIQIVSNDTFVHNDDLRYSSSDKICYFEEKILPKEKQELSYRLEELGHFQKLTKSKVFYLCVYYYNPYNLKRPYVDNRIFEKFEIK